MARQILQVSVHAVVGEYTAGAQRSWKELPRKLDQHAKPHTNAA
jgi:hypothetical protein